MNWSTNPAQRLALSVATLCAIGVGASVGLASAQTEQDDLVIANDKALFVAGADSSIAFRGALPACAGKQVAIALYSLGPASRENPALASPRPVVALVGSDGSFEAALPLPSTELDPVTTWAGVSGECIQGTKFARRTIQIGVLDSARNPNGSGAIFIPRWVLAASGNRTDGSTLAERIGTVTVFADGVACIEASLTSSEVIGPDGSARIRIGTESQPSACSRADALLTFRRGDNGLQLIEQRRFLPGVTQPLANVAPNPAATGGSDEVLPPATGAGTGMQDALTFNGWRLAALCIAFAATVATTWRVARRK